MPTTGSYLTGSRNGAHLMRMDTARILKRFFFCERSLALSKAAWVPLIGPLVIKTELPLLIWQDALTADALRERIFELRYPSRLLNLEDERSLKQVFDGARDAPSAAAFLLAVGKVLLPLLSRAYANYLAVTDALADGPTRRFLALALQEKDEQALVIHAWAEELLEQHPEERATALAWADGIAARLEQLGNIVSGEPLPQLSDAPLPGAVAYVTPLEPKRDEQFVRCRFYWPDIIDPSFDYGEGVSLQLRSAVSHLNEVWAVETAALILQAFADELPWEWVTDAARWCYDEARHCRMGHDRLLSWGFAPAELPLGSYIYDSAAGQDLIYRLGMLFFFETKNIGKKPKRARMFHEYGDGVSEHDMEFDWADETIHASYGKHWLATLLKHRGEDPTSYEAIRDQCGVLVAATIASATDTERRAIRELAENLIGKARQPARFEASGSERA